ncbi:hypothetical protein BDZ97DRAFT_1914440 [Flammula alnicola]|nr:hypothetical protein BDZ97DRAFT_1914440 [Flammula alnicola]
MPMPMDPGRPAEPEPGGKRLTGGHPTYTVNTSAYALGVLYTPYHMPLTGCLCSTGGIGAGYTCQHTQPGTRMMLEDWESYPALCQWHPSQQTQNDHQTATDIPAVTHTPPTSAHQPLRHNLRHPALLIDRQLVGRTSLNSGIRWASISMLEGIERDLGQVQRSSGHKETPMPPAREEVRDAYTLETMPPPPLFMLHVVQHIRGPRGNSLCIFKN